MDQIIMVKKGRSTPPFILISGNVKVLCFGAHLQAVEFYLKFDLLSFIHLYGYYSKFRRGECRGEVTGAILVT
jgi:hypothetical protein